MVFSREIALYRKSGPITTNISIWSIELIVWTRYLAVHTYDEDFCENSYQLIKDKQYDNLNAFIKFECDLNCNLL